MWRGESYSTFPMSFRKKKGKQIHKIKKKKSLIGKHCSSP